MLVKNRQFEPTPPLFDPTGITLRYLAFESHLASEN